MGTVAVAGDRVLRSTRIVAAVIIPFLLLAFAVLFPVPARAGDVFAWDIKPSMSAMVLGSVYIGGAYFFVRVICASRWHTIAGGFVPVATFAGLMGIATVLHWDRFRHEALAFWLWTALYFTTPVIVFVIFFRNEREYRPGGHSEPEMSRAASTIIVAAGALSALTSAVLYLFPLRIVSIWPWQLTALTARMLGAIFALGIAGLFALRDRRWSSARILVQVAVIMLILIIAAGVRARAEFDPSNPLTWLFAIGFGVALLAALGLYARMESRGREGRRR